MNYDSRWGSAKSKKERLSYRHCRLRLSPDCTPDCAVKQSEV